MDIDSFIGYLAQFSDVARMNRYFTSIVQPPGLTQSYGQVNRQLAMQCEASELPGRTLVTFDARAYGPTIKFPYQTSYSDLTLTFICTGNRASEDSGLWEKVFFDDWMELINPTPNSVTKGKYNIEYKKQYATTITVDHFDTNGARTYSVDFIDAYPIAVNQLSLNWQSEDLLRLSVNFAYTRWERTTAQFNQDQVSSFDSFSTNQKTGGYPPQELNEDGSAVYGYNDNLTPDGNLITTPEK